MKRGVNSQRWRAAWRCAAGCALAVLGAAAFAADYEAAGPVQASRYLSAGQLQGPEWKVAPQAINDGVFNNYTVESRFGKFPARGSTALGRRVKEVEALAELEKVSKSDVFVDALKASALAPVQVVQSFTDQPVETVKGIGGGVKRMFGKTKFQAQEYSHDAKEAAGKVTNGDAEGSDGDSASKTQKAKEAASAYAKKYLGTSAAERKWYAQLGVDPYTDNEPLKKAVKDISRVEAAGKFGMRFVGLPSVPGARELGKVMDMVWKTDPWELRKRNREILLGAGLTEDQARAFEDNAALSPTLQTMLIEALVQLQGVRGRNLVVARATETEDEDSARVLVTSTALLTRLHKQSPLTEILGGATLPVARTRDGRLVAVAPLEAVFWTDEVAEVARGFAGLYAGEKATSHELRIVGEASPRVKSELEALGWKTIDRWQVAAREDKTAS